MNSQGTALNKTLVATLCCASVRFLSGMDPDMAVKIRFANERLELAVIISVSERSSTRTNNYPVTILPSAAQRHIFLGTHDSELYSRKELRWKSAPLVGNW